MATKTKPAQAMRRCIGSARFGIEAHEAPISDFPAQPSQKDGLGRMCHSHWTQYMRALRTASRAAKGEKAPADAAPAKAKPARLKPETKGEKAMRVPIVRSGSDAEAQATLRERVRAAGGSLPANAEAEPPTPRNGRRSKARDADVDTAVSEDIGGLEAQAAEEIAREPETLGVNRGEFASE